MKDNTPLKNLSLLSFTVLALSLPFTAAFAGEGDTGGADTGGGNTINGIVIENYQQATDELEGWADAEKVILAIKSDIPLFGKELEERAQKLRWYVLPTRFDQLPANITQIGVASDQLAVHVRGEVYIDHVRWNEPEMTLAKKTGFILHEIVLAQYFKVKNESNSKYPLVQEALSMSDMRRISNLVINYTAGDMDALQSELLNRNYGYYISQNVTKIYLQFTEKELSRALSICDSGKEESLRNMSLSLGILNLIYFNDPIPYGGNRNTKLLETQRLFQRQDRLITPLFLLWADIVEQIFPSDFLWAPSRFSLQAGHLFDQVFPNSPSAEWNLAEGAKACEKLRQFDPSQLKIKISL